MSARAAAVVLIWLAAGAWAGTHAPGAAGETDPTSADIVASGAGEAHYDLFAPAVPPRGVVILVHGGGWQDWPGLARAQLTETAVSFQNDGFMVLDASYAQAPGVDDPGAADPSPKGALDDIVAFVDQASAAFPGLPICLVGQSAGAQLALMAAIERPSIACVIDESGPTDLPAWQQAAAEGAGGPGPFSCSSAPTMSWWFADCYTGQIFGSDPADLQFWSPALRWDPTVDHTALLIAEEQDDPYVLPINATAMATADPQAQLDVLDGDPNGVMFIHSLVDPAQATAFDHEQFSFVEAHSLPAGGSATTVPSVSSDGTITTCNAAAGAPPAGGSALGAWRSSLLTSGDAWMQLPAPDGSVVAADGCSGSQASNDDGISLFVPATAPGAPSAPSGRMASQVISAPAGRELTWITTSARGFVSAGWTVRLLAMGADGASTDLATCTVVGCAGLDGIPSYGGELIWSGTGVANAEQAEDLPDASFSLPAGTKAIVLNLACLASVGCSRATLNADGDPSSTAPLRARDPNGSPAIVSLYDAVVGTAAEPAPSTPARAARPKSRRRGVRVVRVRRIGARRVVVELACEGPSRCHIRVRIRAGRHSVNARTVVPASSRRALVVVVPRGSTRLRVTAWLDHGHR